VKQGPVTVNISVRDFRGMPLTAPALVHLHSTVGSFDVKLGTGEGSAAIFTRVSPGNYEVEVHCQGFRDTSEQVSVYSFGSDITLYIYLQPDTGDAGSKPASGIVMSPKLQAELDKGLQDMRKKQYEAARSQFSKAAKIAPSNTDVLFLLGTSELALQHTEQARTQFETVLKLDPAYEKALLAVGELQLQSGDTSAAIVSLEKAFDVNGASWRTHLLLATAYARAERLKDAEAHAARAASLAQEKGAFATFLLGEIQYAEGEWLQAKASWELVVSQFPNDPVVPKAKEKLKRTAEWRPEDGTAATANISPVVAPAAMMVPVVERPWAPPDIDSKEYRLASNAPCQIDEVLAHALHRMNAQMENFEKFTATERIEHQEVDRVGMPGPVQSRDFYYIVFVHPFKDNSVYLEENRTSLTNVDAFPTSLATTGLNSLGVSVLQPAYSTDIAYECEGLTNVRGEAAWQIRFQDERTTGTSMRQWRKAGRLYDIPIKGRIWVAAASFDLLRIETDLIHPVSQLELDRDHLSVDYGPVDFESGKARLWLPWSAEMYMELHRKRYHHKHFLTDYMLFAVDTSHKVNNPKPPAETEQER